VDRELAVHVERVMPDARSAARVNRAFLGRAVRYMIEQGITQFLDIGSGIPTVANVHEVAQAENPECRVVYVDKDPIAVAHSELMLADNDRAAIVHAGGTLATGAGDGGVAPGRALLAATIAAKNQATGSQLFWRSVLCNLLVCLGLWMAARTDNDMAKLGVLWWALLAFIASGFEHSVANMTIFALGVFDGVATWADLARNLAWTVPGNVVGGGLLIGLTYAWIGGPPPGIPAWQHGIEDREVPESAQAPAG
jgi:hypothetical protein